MLLYKNGRFYSDKFSFLLPEGFYFEDDPEVNYEHGFCAWPPGRDYLCVWHIYENSRGSAVELANWLLPECGFVGLSPVTPIQVNGLSGHYLLYKTGGTNTMRPVLTWGMGRSYPFWWRLRARTSADSSGPRLFMPPSRAFRLYKKKS